jgi:hypothetical protein
MTFSPIPTTLEEAKKEILMWREEYKRMKQAVQPAQHTQVAKEDIAAAWCAGYYHAGYTHDSAYAVNMADEFAEQWGAQPYTEADCKASEARWAKKIDIHPDEFKCPYCFDKGPAQIPEGWREFVENIAKANSEPLNSLAGGSDNASRFHWVGVIRKRARDLLAAAPSTKEKAE